MNEVETIETIQTALQLAPRKSKMIRTPATCDRCGFSVDATTTGVESEKCYRCVDGRMVSDHRWRILVVWDDGEEEYLNRGRSGTTPAVFDDKDEAEGMADFMRRGMERVRSITVVTDIGNRCGACGEPDCGGRCVAGA
jgi:hypothetical protein